MRNKCLIFTPDYKQSNSFRKRRQESTLPNTRSKTCARIGLEVIKLFDLRLRDVADMETRWEQDIRTQGHLDAGRFGAKIK